MSVLRLINSVNKCMNFYLSSNSLGSKRCYASVKKITVFLVQPDGIKHKVTGEVDGKCTLLDLIHDNLDMVEYGVCGGVPSCTTCHVIFHPEDYNKISESPDELELDLLDKALELTETSRLGCQVVLKEFMDGMEIKLPSETRDYRNVDPE